MPTPTEWRENLCLLVGVRFLPFQSNRCVRILPFLHLLIYICLGSSSLGLVLYNAQSPGVKASQNAQLDPYFENVHTLGLCPVLTNI